MDTETYLTAGNPSVVTLPPASTVLTTGLVPKTNPLVALPGCEIQANPSASPKPTTMLLDWMEALPAVTVRLLMPRLVRYSPENVATLLTGAATMPSGLRFTFPLPPVSVTVTREAAKFPYPSVSDTMGCCANGSPTLPLAEGCWAITKLAAAPPVTVSTPD